ncbi:MAG TPA: restriction endonuclease subunit R, partial [Thermoanaerobaculia bacterium]|nr:restriction endonuclease subunit R [Thermoanaerobaculia bacterium]
MSTPEGRSQALTAALAAIEAELAELNSRRAELERRRAELREEAGRTVPENGPVGAATSVGSSSLDARGKVALFRSLFRGREDVFPRLWVNTKTGKKGYAPACRNEWVRGVCDKPRVRCGECLAQAFVPVSDDVVLDHLQGRHVVGCYPLLLDETCWFVAVDFDKAQWRADGTAFARTCTPLGLP